jgi:hypothetical protein
MWLRPNRKPFAVCLFSCRFLGSQKTARFAQNRLSPSQHSEKNKPIVLTRFQPNLMDLWAIGTAFGGLSGSHWRRYLHLNGLLHAHHNYLEAMTIERSIWDLFLLLRNWRRVLLRNLLDGFLSGRVPKQVIRVAKPGSQGLSSTLSEQWVWTVSLF